MTVERYGGFWRRALAFAIDAAIIFVVVHLLLLTGVVALLLGRLTPDEWPALITYGGPLFLGYAAAASFVTKFLYFVYFHGAGGRTPGKMIMGLRVRPLDGSPMTFGLAFLRWVGYIVSLLPLYLGFLWIAVDRRKRGWHDHIAGTVVVYERKKRVETPPSAPEKDLDKEDYII
ncbi:MAG TPA: RDD family protein [Syntrophales bacterium]|nr:RDD family protein [Syntrophales bacterium]